MREKILAMLTEKFSGARKDGLEVLASTLALQNGDEETAKNAVDGLTLEAVTDFIKQYRSGVDREVTASSKVIENNLKKKLEAEPQIQAPSPAPIQKVDSTPDGEDKNQYEAMQAQIKMLTEQLRMMQAQNTYQAREKILLEKLNNAPQYLKDEIVDNFNNRTFNTDEDFNTFIDAKTKAVEVALQNQVENDLRGDYGRPLVGSSKDPDEQMPPSMLAWMKEQKGESARVGKAI